MNTTNLIRSTLLFGLLVLPGAALGQDSDGDGAPDNVDAAPCDAALASVSYFPSANGSALLAFEDQWPGDTDLDYNDVVVRVHWRMERDAAGQVLRLYGVVDPVAVGGILRNGLALQLPTARDGVSARRRVAGGSWQPLLLRADASATMVLSDDLRELYGDVDGRINSLTTEPLRQGQRLEVEVTFTTPATMSTGAAPFDVFIFRAGDFSHQIHFPQYGGTSEMNGALFGSGQDGSTASRRFVHTSGTPAALNLMTTTRYPIEGVPVSALFPNIVAFATSGGTTQQDFYSSNVVSSQGHVTAAPAIASVPAPDTTCTQGSLQIGQSGYGDDVTANGRYGIQAVRYYSSSEAGNIVTLNWPLAFVTGGSWTGGGSPTNGYWHGLHSGCGNRNGVATCRAVCESLGWTYYQVNSNCSTYYPTAGFNANGRNIYMMNSSGTPNGTWNTYRPDPATGNGNNMEFCRCRR